MARSNKSSRRDDDSTELPPELPPLPGGSDDERAERAERDIDDVLGQVGSSAIVRILRINPDTGNPAYAGQIKAEDFTLDMLTEVYGGGSYWLKVYDGKELIDKVRYDVDPSIPARNPRAPKVTAAAQPQQNGSELLMAIVTQSALASQRTMELMTTMMGGFTTAMTGMMNAKNANAPATDPLQMLRTAAEIMRPTTPARSAISDLKEMMEISNMMRDGSGGGGGDGEMAVISKAMDTVGKIVDNAKNNPPRPMQMRPLPPRVPAVAVPAVSQSSVEAPDIMRPWMRKVLPQVPMLRLMIGSVAPETAAGVIDNVLNPGEENSPEFGDLVQDMTDGLQEGADVTAESFLPFAARVASAFQLPNESVLWLSQIALELLVIANDQLAEEEPAAPVSQAPVSGTVEIKSTGDDNAR